MKLLIYTHVFPFPLTEGGKVAQFGFIEFFAKEHEVLLVTDGSYNGVREDAAKLNKIIPHLKIKILDKEKIYTDKGIVATLYNVVTKMQWRLNKRLSAKRPKSSKVTDNTRFIYPARPKSSEIIDQLVKIVSEEKPDIVQVDFMDNADLVNVLPTDMPKVLIHHDLRFISVMQACKLEGKSESFSDYLSDYVRTIEIAFLNKFSGIVTFSDNDKNKISPDLTRTEVISIPFPVLDKNIAKINNNHYQIDNLIFIGPEQHYPNYDAIEWYAKEMAPLIWQQCKLKLIVIGKWLNVTIQQQFTGIEGIEFVGYVEDLKKVFQNAVMLVPLRIGSGIRTKLLDAFGYGVPVISTSLGCEGLGAQNGEDLMVANTPEQFLEAIQFLISNPALVKNLRHKANQLVRQNFSQKSIYDSRLRFYNKLLNENLSV